MKEEDFINVRGEIGIFDPVIPDIRNWPIYKISKDRKKLMEKVSRETFQNLTAGKESTAELKELLAHAYHQERQRTKENPWKADPPDDVKYWKSVRKRIVKINQSEAEPHIVKAESENLLRDIIDRYTEEITGDFKMNSFKFAKKATTFGFSRLFYASTEGFFRGMFKSDVNPLLEKIKLTGELEKIRTLAKKGTIILVPTHFSNLDSIIVGWAIEALGLPAFTYGAGINLFGHPVLSYFMSRLGAYTVDRRKKNKVYLDCLKTYSKTVVKYGCHTLFFPGGTRSRSGAIERKLKLGLLGTMIDAQQDHVVEQPDNPKKIFIVPLVINYHFVLEAASLIDQHLKKTAKERYYLLNDDFNSLRNNLSFLWKFFGRRSDMMLSFGEPFDLFGNNVDDEGRSLDKTGQEINIGGYFQREGEYVADVQRNIQFTDRLGGIILDRFYKENVVFPSHLVANIAFKYFKKKEGRLDLIDFLSTTAEDYLMHVEEMETEIQEQVKVLEGLAKEGKLQLSEEMAFPPEKILKRGIDNLCVYHPQKPLKIINNKWVGTDSLKLLYFYHNRMEGYGL